MRIHFEKIQRTLKRIWKHDLTIAVIAAVVGAVAGAFLQYYVDRMRHPDPPSTLEIEERIRQEAAFARGVHSDREKDLEEYGDLFAKDAVVVDFKKAKIWKGQSEIVSRLRDLHFTKLLHVSRQIVIEPDGSSAVAQTDTIFSQDQPSTSVLTDVQGTESWRFRKIDGRWRIVSFEFNE